MRIPKFDEWFETTETTETPRQPRQPRPTKPPKTGGQIVTDGGSHAPTRTRGRRSDLCDGSSELGGGGDGWLGFVTDASRGAVSALGAFRAKIVKIYPKTDQNRGANRNRRGPAPARAASGPWCRPVLRRRYYGRRR